MGLNFVVDTNIAIYELHDELDEPLPLKNVTISVVTEIELLGFPGLSIEEETGIRALMSGLTIAPLDNAIKDEAIRLRRLLRFRLPDAIVLATAVVTGSELLTNDRDFAAKAATVVPCRSLAMKPRP